MARGPDLDKGRGVASGARGRQDSRAARGAPPAAPTDAASAAGRLGPVAVTKAISDKDRARSDESRGRAALVAAVWDRSVAVVHAVAPAAAAARRRGQGWRRRR